ncbi:MAG: hypothetical protein JWQ96_2956 [Segetibacter sp.]|nr:hypothetical protein [Segetibacter sp.]
MAGGLKIKLYTAYHKSAFLPAADYVIPIQVGAVSATSKLDMIRDDEGENISKYNSFFSELTALYWIWKQADRSESEAWGICHYRRYFTLDKCKLFFIKKSRVYYQFNPENLESVLSKQLYNKLEELLEENDVILQRPTYAHKKQGKVYTIEQAYSIAHDPEDWKTTVNVLLEKYAEYSQSIDSFCKQTKMSYYNMMVARWNVWEEYLTWVFDILFEVQRRIKIDEDPYQARVFGFLSERLLNLYVYHNKLKAGYLTIALFEK